MGAHFDLGKDNGYDLGREGGHSHRRVIHAQDMTGAEVERILAEKVLAHPNIRVFENHMGVDLITRQRLVRRGAVVANVEESCLGAYVLNTHDRGSGHLSWPPSPCWPPGAWARSTSIPATRTSPPETASPWPTGPGPGSATWNLSSSTPPASITRRPKIS